jgi:dienelactone hydrolase
VFTAALAGLVSGCGSSASGTFTSPSASPALAGDSGEGAMGQPSTVPSTAASSAAPAPRAPTKTFALSVRQLNLSRGADRPLRTMVWSPVGSGRFPLVLFSHGLHGTPEGYQNVAKRIAGAGFVVAAPAYPYTNGNSTAFTSADMPNQPADASQVITDVLKSDLGAHIDSAKIAAAGHSAGGYTTAGMLSGKTRDSRLRAGIVIAGGQMNGNFTGSAATVLFVHGDKDPTVPYTTGRNAYGKVPWSKAFLTLLGGDHGSYLWNSGAAADATTKTMLDFLRWTLYGDAVARGRLKSDGTVAGAAKYESTF